MDLNSTRNQCPICGSECEAEPQKNAELFYDCPTCGRIAISFDPNDTAPKDLSKLSSYLYYNCKIDQPIRTEPGFYFSYIVSKQRFDQQYEKTPYCYHITNDVVEAWYPKTFAEKVDLFLLGLAKRSSFMGDLVILTQEQLRAACFVFREAPNSVLKQLDFIKEQYQFFLEYLENEKYISMESSGIIIQAAGWKRIDELQKRTNEASKNAFVAMSFAKEMDSLREAIKDVIYECGYNPRVMDEIEHNHQIVPEMLYEIRQAKFVIAELTGHNNGAYFEAGYALGIGKEVIQVCSNEELNSQLHFDVKQINSIVWNDENELKQKLKKRIEATVGRYKG